MYTKLLSKAFSIRNFFKRNAYNFYGKLAFSYNKFLHCYPRFSN